MARIPEENRRLRCLSCGFTVDRDVRAATDIVAASMRAVRFAAVAPAGEAMVWEPLDQQATLQSMQVKEGVLPKAGVKV